MSSENTIKMEVREHYGAFARSVLEGEQASCCSSSSPSSCCSTGSDVCCSSESQLYDAATLGEIPDAVASTTRGCGNPIALAGLREGERVLDIGSGGGLDVLLAARRVGPTGFVYGLDMTDDMLALARRNAEQVGATNVEFLKGEIENIPLPDQSVDVIISNCVINLSPEKGATLSEAFRVLAPGGRLAISDIVIDGDLEGLALSEAQLRAALSWAGCIAGALTMDQYRTLLAEAGFERIEIEVTQRYSSADILASLPAELASIPVAQIEQAAQRFTSSSISAYRPL